MDTHVQNLKLTLVIVLVSHILRTVKRRNQDLTILVVFRHTCDFGVHGTLLVVVY